MTENKEFELLYFDLINMTISVTINEGKYRECLQYLLLCVFQLLVVKMKKNEKNICKFQHINSLNLAKTLKKRVFSF